MSPVPNVNDGKTMCQSCKQNPAEPLHTCPFREEINDDSKTLCNCCPRCRSECSDDI